MAESTTTTRRGASGGRPRAPTGVARTAPAALTAYRQKRDFARTREPPARASAAPTQPELTFVVQKHAARRHLGDGPRLEDAVELEPEVVVQSLDPAEKRLAVQVEDHPLEYGSFEGTIPAGQYGGGEVVVWDRGTYAPLDERTPGEASRRGAEARAPAWPPASSPSPCAAPGCAGSGRSSGPGAGKTSGSSSSAATRSPTRGATSWRPTGRWSRA